MLYKKYPLYLFLYQLYFEQIFLFQHVIKNILPGTLFAFPSF